MKISRADTLTRAIEIPAVEVPDAMMFGYPSRLVDAWRPSVERLIMPGFIDNARTIRLTIGQNHLTVAKLPTAERLGLWPKMKRRVRNKIGDLGNTINVDDKLVVDFRHQDSGNVAHFAHRIVLILVIISNNLSNFCINKDILCVFAKNPDSLTLKLVEYFKLRAIFTDSPVFGNIALLHDIDNDKNAYYGAIPLLANFPIPNYRLNTPKKIFISRRNSRTLRNEMEISNYLAGLGYEHLYFEDLELCDQFSIGRNATHVVAIHGAALGVLAFNALSACESNLGDASQLQLIELFSPAFVVSPFRRYIAALGGKWVGVRGQITPQIIKELDDWNGVSQSAYKSFNIDLYSLELALKHCMND